ncbi:MAG: HNH endonuclease [Deltaproteobacteria bacterium]|nr:HNH endonuclease [Deltaproteobacteria bacterium]
MQFQRGKNVPRLSNYQDYRPYLRRDFLRHCAYCTGHEDEMGGEEHYEIDHYRPMSKFPKLTNKYSNLYYSCHGCNKRGAKGNNWPSKYLYRRGFRFFDPVVENAYQLHMRDTSSGHLIKKTNVGNYSIRILRLNRQGLLTLRGGRRTMRAILRKELGRLLRVLERTKKLGYQPSPATLTRLVLVRQRLQTRPILNLLPDWWKA